MKETAHAANMAVSGRNFYRVIWRKAKTA